MSYHSRSREQGKKIRWTDGVHCLWILARVRRTGPLTKSSVETVTGADSSTVAGLTAVSELDLSMHPRPLRSADDRDSSRIALP